MKIRNLVLVAGLATVLGGCVVAPRPYYGPGRYNNPPPPVSDDYYDDDYYDTPSYHGYYDVRVIFVGTIPYYVDDDRHIRPIPPEYRGYFERRRYLARNRRLAGPRFSRNDEVRDGYHTSRIVYLGDTPYYVDEGRGAQPLPRQLHERFRYTPLPPSRRQEERGPVQRNNDSRVMRPDDNRDRNDAPAFSRDRDRNDTPAYGRERDRNDAPAYGRERDRNDAPAYGRDRDRNDTPAYGRERDRNDAPAYGRERDRNDAPAYGRERDRNDAPAFGRDRNDPPAAGREPERNDAPAFGRDRNRNDAPAFGRESQRTEPPATNRGRVEMRNSVQERSTSPQPAQESNGKRNSRGNPRPNTHGNQGNGDNQDNQNGNDDRRRDR